jgi:hypothetical protein
MKTQPRVIVNGVSMFLRYMQVHGENNCRKNIIF